MEKPKYPENTHFTKHMPTKKQIEAELQELKETIQDTTTLIQNLIDQPDPNTIRQLDWNLGWHNGIYHLDIIEDPEYDPQALNLAAKVLRQILEPQEETPTTDKQTQQ